MDNFTNNADNIVCFALQHSYIVFYNSSHRIVAIFLLYLHFLKKKERPICSNPHCLCHCVCVCVYASACVAFGVQVLSLLFSGSGKWLYYHTSLSWLLLHITDIRHCLHFCPRQLWVCGDHVRNFSGALGLIGCVSYISDKYTHLWKVAGNVSSLYHFILVLLTCNITTTQRSLYKCFRT